MSRMDSIFSKLLLIFLSFLFTAFIIESAANYYLWNMTTEEQFRLFASVNQVKERYGQDFFVTDNTNVSISYIPHQYLGYVLTPNYEYLDNRHNSLGFRGEEFDVPKADGVYRIVTIGASTTYDTGVLNNYKNSYAYLLEKYLRSKGYKNVEVVNAGIGAYTSFESLMNLQFRVLDIDPDLIIIYHAVNDAHTRLVYPFSAYKSDNSGYRAPFIQDTKMPNIWEYSTALRIIGIQMGWTVSHNALEWSRFREAATSYRALFKDQKQQGIYPSGIFAEVSAMDMIEANPPIYFERNMQSMADIAHGRGIDVMFSTFAYDPKFTNEPTASTDEYILMLDQHNEVTRQVAERSNSYFYDLAETMPEDERYYTDGYHMNREGNLLRAQLFGDYIIESIFKAESTTP